VVERPGLSKPRECNQVWALDYKGWFRLGNGERCEPLTVSDLATRYLLCCQGCPNVSYEQARPVFEKLFKEHGLPRGVRVDNGPPFGSMGAGGLSRLAVWWVSLGIQVEYIDPGHPEQNGAHERMHRTLKAEAVYPVGRSMRAQQKRFDFWRWEYNEERPHEALGQVVPASVYQKSERVYDGCIETPGYPEDHVIRRVRSNGEIHWLGEKRFIGEAYIGQSLAIIPSEAGKQLVYFYKYLLGELEDQKGGKFKPVVWIRRRGQTSKEKPEEKSF
jgi:hypothetical protein